MEVTTDTLCGRPLTFGDTEQIVALKAMRARAGLLEGDDKRYEVTIGYSGSVKISISAKCEIDAENKAEALFDSSDVEIDCWDIEDVECLSKEGKSENFM